MDNVEIGKKIKRVREERNMSLQDVADATGVARSTIQRYETGQIDKIKLPVIESIARSLGVRPDWVIGKTDKKFPETVPVPDILIYYNSLNTDGKNVATEHVRLLTLDEKYTKPAPILSLREPPAEYLGNAAHARTDIEVTDEMREHDDAIMDGEDF